MWNSNRKGTRTWKYKGKWNDRSNNEKNCWDKKINYRGMGRKRKKKNLVERLQGKGKKPEMK